jgi:DNA repair exonuclease SbcCD ATPase subunit
MNYYTNIKPRLDNYYKFKKNYENLLIYKSFIFLEYENDINNYLKLNNLINEKNNKINYNLKMSISKIDDEILNLTNYKSKLETEEKFINNNLIIYNKLSEIEKNTLNIIVVIQIIIDKFKDYKKWLYDNYILKNLVNKTNNYIKLLCHDNCKMFELDYILTENKDIIHINWLIKNILNETNYKQIISINQASGFQNFVISMCLRLSLFGNNICNQLFIDEGFTACDKDNLSIVPNFLKNLLLIFNTITIVSHIDIIQDNIDDKIEIKYNKNTKSSNINFGYRIS